MPTLTFDPDAMHRAILNVVTNAVDACEKVEQGRVTVRTQYAADERLLRIVVEDNGEGIAPEDLAKIFSVFESRKGSRGTGLGLPVSQKIMREHEGDIAVESTPGQGSRFCLSMPAVLAEPADKDAAIRRRADHFRSRSPRAVRSDGGSSPTFRLSRPAVACRSTLAQVRIVFPFLTNRGRAAVAGQDDRVVGQDQQLGADGGEQLVQVAVRESRIARCSPGTARRLRTRPRDRHLSRDTRRVPSNGREWRAPPTPAPLPHTS